MVYLLLFLELTLARQRDDDDYTMLFVEGPLHPLTSNPTTSFETYSATATTSHPTTPVPTISGGSLAPVTNRVYTADNIAVSSPVPDIASPAPDITSPVPDIASPVPGVFNFTYLYSSMSPSIFPSTTLSLPDSTHTNQPTVTHHVTTKQDHVTKKQDYVTKKQDHLTKKQDHVTKKEDHVTKKEDHAGDGYDWRKHCERCVLLQPIGYLVCCLVLLGLLSNLFSYFYFWRHLPGLTGLLHGIFIVSDVLILLCIVPVAISYIRFEKTSFPTYSKVWFYTWNFSLRLNFFLLSLVSLRSVAEGRRKIISVKMGAALCGGGGAFLLLLTLLPLFLEPVYRRDYSLLFYDLKMSKGVTVGYHVLMGVLVLITLLGIVFVLILPLQKKYSIVSLGQRTKNKERPAPDLSSEKKEKRVNVGNHRLFTVLFCVLNLALKSPFIIVHSLGRSKSTSETPLLWAALIILALGSSLSNTVICLLAFYCRSRDIATARSVTATASLSQEQPV